MFVINCNNMNERTKTKVKAFSFKPETVEKIVFHAEKQNRSASNFVETVLSEYFKENELTGIKQETYRTVGTARFGLLNVKDVRSIFHNVNENRYHTLMCGVTNPSKVEHQRREITEYFQYHFGSEKYEIVYGVDFVNGFAVGSSRWSVNGMVCEYSNTNRTQENRNVMCDYDIDYECVLIIFFIKR